ncbi:B12-binding domain-containing protein [Acidiferrimicrobium sp. IK]|uniref:B12-binding domain-containing protein n=1 Tax=Acidiferrimicrobium sp. IK TaxID=2871700 RepID=UPI0021CB8E79|nr:B12-binding domain-containing protein [Acidiferrimicrobium sp. IK]MCU4185883.1 B12-binding domain-containing protein [Acidiferrimicrobium sp. IK]
MREPAAPAPAPAGEDGAGGTRITLHDAAGRLGVHYQTAYRWVRSGALRAAKIGGVYQVEVGDLEAFDRERRRPSPPPPERVVRDWERFAAQLHQALIAGEEGAARDLVEGLVGSGVRVVDCCDRLIGPAMRKIGDQWEAGQLTVADERRASAICERLLGRLTPAPPGRPRGVAVVCSPPVEEHQLPGGMATAALREDHWRVHHLGVNVPFEELVGMIRRVGPDLVVVSVTWLPASEQAEALAAAVRRLGPPVLVGGSGRALAELITQARAA